MPNIAIPIVGIVLICSSFGGIIGSTWLEGNDKKTAFRVGIGMLIIGVIMLFWR